MALQTINASISLPNERRLGSSRIRLFMPKGLSFLYHYTLQGSALEFLGLAFKAILSLVSSTAFALGLRSNRGPPKPYG